MVLLRSSNAARACRGAVRVLCLLSACIFRTAAQEPPSFTASTNLVVLDVRVFQRGTGRPIEGLKREDFEVRDEGKLQILKIAESGTFPLDVAILLDVSGSVIQSTRQLASGADAAAHALRREDRAAVLTFSSKCQLQQEFTSNPDRIADGIQRSLASVTRVESGTRLFDAIASALDMYPARADKLRRRALIVATDDQERSSKIRLPALTSEALEKDATVNGVILISVEPRNQTTIGRARTPIPIPGIPPVVLDRSYPLPKAHTLSMEPLVNETGGEYLHPIDNPAALLQMLDHLRARYILAYVLPQEQRIPGQHRVEVDLCPSAHQRYPDALVRTRPYYRF
ncbi:MAG: VWA domain-containing protein [Acidobacteriaceae bacterium]|nr:VWA domain-containing protein [Acidobacteriaceae bacterium]